MKIQKISGSKEMGLFRAGISERGVCADWSTCVGIWPQARRLCGGIGFAPET
jgi:hypothetical protein